MTNYMGFEIEAVDGGFTWAHAAYRTFATVEDVQADIVDYAEGEMASAMDSREDY